MNKRIQELAQEAKEFADYYAMLSDAKEQDVFTEKFAELIVRECARIIQRPGSYEETYLSIAGNQIKQNFGVEE